LRREGVPWREEARPLVGFQPFETPLGE